MKALEEFSPSIVLSDHSLPSFNSIEALKILRETGSIIPFILVTGTMSEEFAVDIMKQGASDYILKSNLQRLPSAIFGAVEKWQIHLAKEKAEEKILQMNEELRDLSTHLQIIREEERASISRELHDELGQQLIRLKMDIMWMGSKIETQNEEVIQKIASSIQLVNDTVETIRRINTDLRPQIIDDLGLFAAIEWQANEFTKHTGIQCNLNISLDEPEFSNLLSIQIFRIYQEALNNVAKHAHVNEIFTELRHSDGKMVMSIQDHGNGFDTGSKRPQKSFGLLGMKERAILVDGTVEVLSQPGKGTTVKLTVPIIYN
jgi:signal transduction histidine kinase